jgi:diguanylate cyclase (GGDEF)-like protein
MTNHALALTRERLSINIKRVDSLIERADLLVSRDNERALACAYQAYDIAVTLSDEPRIAACLLQRGRIEYYLAEYETAEKTLIKALEFFVKHKNLDGQSRCHLTLGLIRLVKGAYSRALENFLNALPMLQNLGRKRDEGRCTMHIGAVYSFLDDYPTCLDYYLQALKIVQLNGDLEDNIILHLNIGDSLQRLEQCEESLEYYERALRIAEDFKSQHLMSVALINMGEAHARLNQFEKAGQWLNKGLELARALKKRSEEVRALGIMIQVGRELKHCQNSAEELYRQGRKLSRFYNLPHGELILHLNYAEHLDHQAQFDEAIEICHKALELSKRFGLQNETARAHQILQSVFYHRKDFEKAFEHLQIYHELKKKSQIEKQVKRIEALTIKNEAEKALEVAALQTALNKELQKANQELERTNAQLLLAFEQNQALLAQVQHQADHDFLTNLPSRTLFEDRLTQAYAQAVRKKAAFAVMYLDLDGFKNVNDAVGHEAGDALLIEIANRLKSILRESDTVGRMGGDEFAFILTNLNGEQRSAVELIANKIIASVESKFVFESQDFFVSCSIGISFYPSDGAHPKVLLKRADQAMYCVKQNGKGKFAFYKDVSTAPRSSQSVNELTNNFQNAVG